MRPIALVPLAVVLALAGCLGVPGDPDGADPSPSSAPADASSAEAEGRNGTKGPTGNGTDGNATGDPTEGGNGTDDDTEPTGPTLPANVTMEGAEVVARNRTAVTFRWNGTLPGTTAPGERAEVGARFDVPDGLPLRIGAAVAWSDGTDLVLEVTDDPVNWFCQAEPAPDRGRGGCDVRTFRRSSWDSWNLTLERTGDQERANRGNPPVPRAATPFAARLTLEVVEPWSGPPVEQADLAGNGSHDPGWPAVGDAPIRPSVKVGRDALFQYDSTEALPVNSGTGNFVFSSPDNGTLYLGWIAHGTPGLEPGDHLSLGIDQANGTLVYCSWGAVMETVTCPQVEPPPRWFYNDFALIRIPDSARDLVHPAVRFWGGPTGLAPAPSQGDLLMAFGNTPVRDGGRTEANALDPQRLLVHSSTERKSEVSSVGPAIPGDSGSPIMRADGQAIATYSTLEEEEGERRHPGPTESGPVGLANLHHAVSFMEEHTGLDVELKTWRLFETPRVQDLVGATDEP